MLEETQTFLYVFQAEICSTALTEVLQAVVNGSDGCVFSYGHAGLGKWRFFGLLMYLVSLRCSFGWTLKKLTFRYNSGMNFQILGGAKFSYRGYNFCNCILNYIIQLYVFRQNIHNGRSRQYDPQTGNCTLLDCLALQADRRKTREVISKSFVYKIYICLKKVRLALLQSIQEGLLQKRAGKGVVIAG